MTDYIRRNDAFEIIKRTCGDYSAAFAEIRKLPSADVAPVVHSYWEHKITNDGENIGICHNCKYPVNWFWATTKCCPNCGAMMDEPNEPEN